MRLVPVLLVGVAVGGAFFLGRMSHPHLRRSGS